MTDNVIVLTAEFVDDFDSNVEAATCRSYIEEQLVDFPEHT